MLYNRLCTKSKDEPFTEYGQLAAQIQRPEDRSWIIFELHPAAHWHDGAPGTAADVMRFEFLPGSSSYERVLSPLDRLLLWTTTRTAAPTAWRSDECQSQRPMGWAFPTRGGGTRKKRRG